MRRFAAYAVAILMAMMPLATSVARADDGAADVKQIAQALADRTVAAAKDDDPGERRRRLREAGAPALDMQAIGNGVLAYAGAKVPPNRRADVLGQVMNYIGDKIVAEIERIRPETATIGAVDVNGAEGHAVMSLSGVQDSIEIRWLFRKTAEGWRIVDGEVSGMLLTEHFGERLSRYAHGVEQLQEYLRDQVKEGQTAARS